MAVTTRSRQYLHAAARNSTPSCTTPVRHFASKSSNSGGTDGIKNFSEWYLSVVNDAEIAQHGPVRGTMVLRPYGYAIWELLQRQLDDRLKMRRYQNLHMPSLIPFSFLGKEAKHVEGFAPEVAMVTHAGGKELSEPAFVRPTSETLVNWCLSQWVTSYRDLPQRLNQWCNVVRWEKRPRLLLRNSEFLWHEGHSAHATAEEAEGEAWSNIELYTDFARDLCALAVVPGIKSPRETFAGAAHTYCIEGWVGDGRALQCGTSHNLGQNFGQAFDTTFVDMNGQSQHVWQTSFGLSTRFLGALIMTHGDDKGLRLPPAVAPIQISIIPIVGGKKHAPEDGGAALRAACDALRRRLERAGVRCDVDDRDVPLGRKFRDWEKKGVPLRLEIGQQELASRSLLAKRRDGGDSVPIELADDCSLPQVGAEELRATLDHITTDMLALSEAKLSASTVDVANYDQLLSMYGTDDVPGSMGNQWARVWWDGDETDEQEVQTQSGATLRCIPFAFNKYGNGSGDHGECIKTGRQTNRVALFAKAY